MESSFPGSAAAATARAWGRGSRREASSAVSYCRKRRVRAVTAEPVRVTSAAKPPS